MPINATFGYYEKMSMYYATFGSFKTVALLMQDKDLG